MLVRSLTILALCLAAFSLASAQQPAPQSASAPATQPAASPAPGAGAPVNTQATYTVRLRDLERRVDELKEQVFRSKARLNLLKETVLHGAIGGARATILYRNEMS